MINVEKVMSAKKNCGEDSRCSECYCYLEDDCKLNHLTESERQLLKNKESQ